MKDRSPNRRELSLALPNDLLDSPLAEALNARLKILEEMLPATAGLRGPVNIAAQTKKDRRGIRLPGMKHEGNRLAEVGDPIDAQDAATKAWVLEQLKCANLRKILETCSDDSAEADGGGCDCGCQELELSNGKSVSTGMGTVFCVAVLDEFVYVAGI